MFPAGGSAVGIVHAPKAMYAKQHPKNNTHPTIAI